MIPGRYLCLLILLVTAATTAATAHAQFKAHCEHHGVNGGLHSTTNTIWEGCSFELGEVDLEAGYTFTDGFSTSRRMWLEEYGDIWTFANGYLPLIYDNTTSHHGLRSIKIDNCNGDYVGINFPMRLMTGLDEGEYTFSAWVRTTSGGSIARTRIKMRNVKTPLIGSSSSITATNSSWERIQTSLYLAQGEHYEFYISIGDYNEPCPGSNGTLWVDAVQLEKAPAATDFSYHTQAQEIFAYTRNDGGPRAGNLYGSDEDTIRLMLQVFENAPLPATDNHRLHWTIYDRIGHKVGAGNLDLAPSPTGYQEIELLDLAAILDPVLGSGWLGCFRVDLDLMDNLGSTTIDHEEVVITRFEKSPYAVRPYPNSPFGTHLISSGGGSGDYVPSHLMALNCRVEEHFELAEAVGVRWNRDSSAFNWIYCHQEGDLFHWNSLPVILGQAHGLITVANSSAIPGWIDKVPSQGGQSIPASHEWEHYETFLDTMFHGFDDPGPEQLVWYEILNETDHPYLPSHYDPIDYYEFLLRAATAAAAPGLLAPIQIAGPAGSSFVVKWWDTNLNEWREWLRDLLIDMPGAYDALDAVTHHYYTMPISGGSAGNEYEQHGYPEMSATGSRLAFDKNIEEVLRVIADASPTGNPKDKPYWVKEIGWWTVRNYTDVPHMHGSTNLLRYDGMSGSLDRHREAGDWLVRSYILGLAAGVDKLFQFTLASSTSINQTSPYGMLDFDRTGSVSLTAYAAMTARLGPVPRFLRKIQATDLPLAPPHGLDVYACLFVATPLARGASATLPCPGGSPGGTSFGLQGSAGADPGLDQRGPVVAVIWNADYDDPYSLLSQVALIPGKQAEVFDLEGNTINLGGGSSFDVELSGSPVYIVSPAQVEARTVAAALDVVPPRQVAKPTAYIYSSTNYTKLVWPVTGSEYDVVGYRIYRESYPGGPFEPIAHVEGRETADWWDTSPEACGAYKVAAIELITGREGPPSEVSDTVIQP